MNFIKPVLSAAIFAISASAVAGPFDGGIVGGQLKSNVKVDKVTQSNTIGGAGYGKQQMNIGSVNGGVAAGNVELNVQAKEVNQTQRTYGIGYAQQEMNIGSLK